MSFTNTTETSLTLNTDDIGRFHYISQSGVMIDLTELDENVEIATDDEPSGVYLIIQHNDTELLANFSEFTRELQLRLDAGAAMHHLMVPGHFDPDRSQITTHHITVHIN